MLKINFPTLKEWKIDSHVKMDLWPFPAESDVVLEFKDFDIKFNCVFTLNDQGFLRPIVYATDLKWGETKFYHEDWFLELLSFQVIKFMQVVT